MHPLDATYGFSAEDFVGGAYSPIRVAYSRILTRNTGNAVVSVIEFPMLSIVSFEKLTRSISTWRPRSGLDTTGWRFGTICALHLVTRMLVAKAAPTVRVTGITNARTS